MEKSASLMRMVLQQDLDARATINRDWIAGSGGEDGPSARSTTKFEQPPRVLSLVAASRINPDNGSEHENREEADPKPADRVHARGHETRKFLHRLWRSPE